MPNIKRRIPRHHKLIVFVASGAYPKSHGFYGRWFAMCPITMRSAEAETPLEAIKLYFSTYPNKD